MSPRTVTPAEARALLDAATPGPWRVYGNAVDEDALSDAWTIAYDGDTLAELHADDRPEHGSESDESVAALCEADADLIAAAPDLAATVASEPARIAAAVEAERAAIVAHLREWARLLTPRTGVYADALNSAADALNSAADEIAAGRTP